MVRLTEIPAVGRGFISDLTLTIPLVESTPWIPPVPAADRRVSIVSSAAVSKRGDKVFSWLARDCRAIHKDDRDLVMTHASVDYDRTAWQQDLNAIIPLDRLDEMAKDGEIGSVAEEHYTFMGAANPIDMKASVRQTAERMRQDNVNTVFLIPV